MQRRWQWTNNHELGDTMVSRRHKKIEAMTKQKQVSREERKPNKAQLEGLC